MREFLAGEGEFTANLLKEAAVKYACMHHRSCTSFCPGFMVTILYNIENLKEHVTGSVWCNLSLVAYKSTLFTCMMDSGFM